MSGLFGIVSGHECNTDLLLGTDYHHHLGTSFGGLTVMNNSHIWREIHTIHDAQFKEKFLPHYNEVPAAKGIGVVSARDAQPIYQDGRFGPFAMAMDGNIANLEKLAVFLKSRGMTLSEVTYVNGNPEDSMAELTAKIINMGASIPEGIQNVWDMVDGAVSLLLLNEQGVYAARDRHGHSSLTIGRRSDDWAVATSTTSFPNLDFEIHKELQPGEITLINPEGLVDISEGSASSERICTFLWIYTAFPASEFGGINVEIARYAIGAAMARMDAEAGGIEADLVSGVPDSGTAHAIGYAEESGIPFKRPLLKYTPGWAARSYMPTDQKTRDWIAKYKIVPIEKMINGARMIVCEDSLVRGTQLKAKVMNLFELGADTLHIRLHCPPLMWPCKYNIATRGMQELAARRAIRDIEGRDIGDVSQYLNPATSKYAAMVDWIKGELVDWDPKLKGRITLKYLGVQDMADAIGMPLSRLDTYCWTGRET